MCYSHPLYPPYDNQHAASEAIRRRDSSSRSALPPTTSLRPPGYQQSTNAVSEAFPSSSTTRQHSEARRLRVDVPAYVAVGLMGGTAYLIVRARHRTAARLATLQSSRDKAVGQTLGWKHAYLARERHPSASGFQSRRQDFEPRRSHRDGPMQPRNPPGGFIDPRTAEEARREERQALDGPPLFENFADTARRFWGLATGRSLEPNESTAERHDKSRSEAQSGTSKGWQWSWATGACQPQASRQALTPAERWRRAFGAGATTSQSDHSGWEAIVREKTLEKAMEVARSSAPKASGTGLPNAAGEAKEVGEVQPSRRRADTVKQASQKKILVDDAFHDELDSNFLRRHIDKTKTSPSSSPVTPAKPHRESKKDGGKSQHFSMDNLFLEFQLEDAAIEGREARERMQKKLEASKATKIAATASSGAIEAEEDVREARLADPTLYGNDQDAIIDELAAELFKPALPSSHRSAGTPSQLQPQPVEQEQPPTAPKTSLWEAALEYAEEEGAAVRRKREAQHRQRQERLARAAAAAAATSSSEATRAGAGAIRAEEEAQRADVGSDAAPRRVVLEPEDLNEALVLHELALGFGGEGEGVATGQREREREREIDTTNAAAAATVDVDAGIEEAAFLVHQQQHPQQQQEEAPSPSLSPSSASLSPSPSPSSSRLAALEARLDLANAELRLMRSQMGRLHRRLAASERERGE